MRAAIITVLVLLLLLVGIDFGARLIATSAAGSAVQDQTGAEADVSVGGWPFLTQALGGEYDSVTVSVSSLSIGSLSGVRGEVELRGVRFPLSDALSGRVDSLTADHADLTARFPVSALASAAGLSGTTLEGRPDGRLAVRTSTTVAGTSVAVTGVGDVQLTDGMLNVSVDEVSADTPVSGEVTAALADQLAFSVPITGLPVTLEAADIRVDGDDAVLTAAASDFRISDLT